MAIISKKNLLNLINESMTDMDEMAYRKKKTQAPRRNPVTGEYLIHEAIPVFKENNPTPVGGDGVPDAWIINPNKVEGGSKLVVPIGCSELSDFIKENKEWLKSLHVLFQLKPILHYCVSEVNPTGTYKYAPRNIKLGTEYIPSGEHYDAEEIIKRTMYEIIQKYLADEEVNKKLERCSIPLIKPRQVQHLDSHGKINNNEVNYQTHTFNAYDDEEQFLRFVNARMNNIPINDDVKEYHLARQFNTIYQNWKETKKQDKNYLGKTEKYYLDKFGLEQENLSTVVRSDLKIKGKLMGDTYTWTLEYIVKYGSKLKESRKILGGLNLNRDVVFNKTANVSEETTSGEKPFTDNKEIKNYTIIDDVNIQAALAYCLSELREMILSNEFGPIQLNRKVQEPTRISNRK